MAGFGGDFFASVLGAESNPLRDFLGEGRSTNPDPLGLGSRESSSWFAPLAPTLFGSAPTFDYWSPIQVTGTGGLARRAGMGAEAKPKDPQVARPKGVIARALEKERQAAQAQAGGTAAGETDLQVDAASPYYTLAIQIASEEGVDPTIFTRLVAQESRYNPRATSRMGAQGLTQLMPETAAALGVTDPYDPEQNLRGGARYLKQMLDRYGGDYTKALAAYNAGPGNVDTYGGVPPFTETQEYVRRIQGAPRQPAQAEQRRDQSFIVTDVPEPPAGVKPLRGITTYQYGDEALATGAADYICGPIAAQAFVRTQGRNPTLREALDLARQLGVIDPDNGMHGIEATASLIRKLGGYATVGKVDRDQIIAEVQAGRPVIIDTDAGSRGHYFVVEGYDPETGRFDLGNSARALRASQGRTTYTLEEISSLGFGAPHAAIYAR